MKPQPSLAPSVQVSRRQIREAAVQLLHPNPTEAQFFDSQHDPWPLVLAQALARITRTRARAILHLQQNRPRRFQAVWDLRVVAQTQLNTYFEDRTAARCLRAILQCEQQLPDLFESLKRQLKSEKEPERIEESLLEIRSLNTEALEQERALAELLGPVDACPKPLQPFAKVLFPLLDSAVLLHSLFGEKLSEKPELLALREALAECAFLKKEAQGLVQLVMDHLAETDQRIAEKLENFAPERLAQIDRAVLRLAATELHYCPEVPAAVSINEAIEIARRYGGIESAGFVNGLLDKLKPTEG